MEVFLWAGNFTGLPDTIALSMESFFAVRLIWDEDLSYLFD
jgi:hypothetical protein